MKQVSEPVGTYMSTPVHVIAADTKLSDVDLRLRELGLSSLAVVESEEIVGVVSCTDLLRVGEMDDAGHHLVLPDRPVSDVMSRDLICVEVDTPLRHAAEKMWEQKIHRVYVTSNGALAGVLSTRDLVTMVHDTGTHRELEAPLSAHMSAPVLTVHADRAISLATEELKRGRVSGLVVVDDHDWPIGVYSQIEALKHSSSPGDTPVENAMSSAILALPPWVPIHRAAKQAAVTRVRRIIVVDNGDVCGILTGLDLAALLI